MVRTVMVKGKKFKVPMIVARDGPFTLIRRLTKPPRPLGIEFVVKRDTRFGKVLVSSNITGKTREQGLVLLKAAVESERLFKASVQAAKRAGAIGVKGLVTAGRLGFQLAERASRPRTRRRKAGNQGKRKTTKRKKR